MKKLIMCITALLLIFSGLFVTEAEAKKTSFAFKMKEMSRLAYHYDSKTSVDEWKFYKTKSFKDGLQYKIFRKKSGSKYDYTFAMAGTQGLGDASVDYQIVMTNQYNTQIATLEKEVNNFYKKKKKLKINKIYFTGHSLGGYLASYVVSDVVQNVRVKDIPKSKVKAYTFNAPGFSDTTIKYEYKKGAHYPNAVKVKEPISAKKIKENKKGKFNKYIRNYQIIGDSISSYQTTLGKIIKVQHENPKASKKKKHKLSSFTKKNL